MRKSFRKTYKNATEIAKGAFSFVQRGLHGNIDTDESFLCALITMGGTFAVMTISGSLIHLQSVAVQADEIYATEEVTTGYIARVIPYSVYRPSIISTNSRNVIYPSIELDGGRRFAFTTPLETTPIEGGTCVHLSYIPLSSRDINPRVFDNYVAHSPYNKGLEGIVTDYYYIQDCEMEK